MRPYYELVAVGKAILLTWCHDINLLFSGCFSTSVRSDLFTDSGKPKCRPAGPADRPVQEIKLNNVHIHANPLASA